MKIMMINESYDRNIHEFEYLSKQKQNAPSEKIKIFSIIYNKMNVSSYLLLIFL